MYFINFRNSNIIVNDFKFLFMVYIGIAFMFLSCSGQGNSANAELNDSRNTSVQQSTLPAIMVSADYKIPKDYVDNTGAYIPQNGKPTIVFVDSIW
tara:strand:+ start:53 stop:340 length:288 start_codon:yes stop_codon:yes gene_type:complete